MKQQPHPLQNSVWQFIGVGLTFVIGILGLFVAIFALPNPEREIFVAISVLIIGFALLAVYAILVHVIANRGLSRKEKVGSGGIAVILLFIVILILIPAIPALNSSNSQSNIKPKATVASAPIPTPTLIVTPSPGSTATSNLPPTPSTTFTSIGNGITVPENQSLQCAGCSYNLVVTVTGVDISSSGMTWHFTVINNEANSCQIVYFNNISYLLDTNDPSQKQYTPQNTNSNWSMNPGDVKKEVVVFAFFIQPNVHYTLRLKVGISLSSCSTTLGVLVLEYNENDFSFYIH